MSTSSAMNATTMTAEDASCGDMPAPESSRHPLAAFRQQLEALVTEGAQRFDPVAFHVIETLLSKAGDQPAQVQRYLSSRLATLLASFEQRFKAAQTSAHALVRDLAAQPVSIADQARQLYDSGHFQAVKALHVRHHANAPTNGLAALVQSMQILPSVEVDSIAHDDHSLESLLKKQEKDLLTALGQDAMPARPARPELKAMQLFRDTWAKVSTERRVTKVVEHAPRDTGPLNSQTLVIRSLNAMRELSPEYATRFVSYVDTLLWLERTGARSETIVDRTAAGKPPAGKGKAKTKPARGRTR